MIRLPFFSKPKVTTSAAGTSRLSIEALEDRMMLSTVSIFASGSTGAESIDVFAGGETRTFDNVSADGDVFVFETSELLSNESVVIQFTNDLYIPEQGIDRNLTVEKIVVDGETIFTTDPSVFADGVWDSVAGELTSGTGLGSTLHANGSFNFHIESTQTNGINFAGFQWDVVEGQGSNATLSTANGSNELNISGIDGPLAISTSFDVVPGEVYNLSFLSERLLLDGQFTSDSQPWATVGINYYNSDGNLISQDRFDVNSVGPDSTSAGIEVSETAASAFVWIWIDGFDADVNIPLRINDFSFTQVDLSADVTPPTAEFTPFTFTENFRGEIDFGVEFRDDVRLDNIPVGSITVVGPDGFEQDPFIATGGPDNTDTFQLLVFGLVESDVESVPFDQTNNGTYTVILNPHTVSDAAGNFAAGRVLGTFTIDITPQPADTTPPNVALLSANDVFDFPTGGRGSDIEIVVEYTDDRSLTSFGNPIIVEGPNGYSGVGTGIAGGGADPNGFFEITFLSLPTDGFWSSNENGTYTISLAENVVEDTSGNFAPGRVLGTFEVNIPGDDSIVG